MRTHSDFYIIWRYAYAIALFALGLQWSSQMGALSFIVAGLISIPCFAVERWIVRREDLIWAVEQVKPLLFFQLRPNDRTCRRRADVIRQLLRDAKNENLVVTDEKGRETAVLVFELYYRDEHNMTETWDQYLGRVEYVRIELERRQLAGYRERNLHWVLERWFHQEA